MTLEDDPLRIAIHAPPEHTSHRWLVPVLCSAAILSALMQTLVIPIVVELPVLLHTSRSNASWVLTATLLASAVSAPIAGRLGDMYGKRRALVCCILLLLLGSLICALSSSLGSLVIGRALQGTATSTIPLGIGIMRDHLPRERVGRWVREQGAESFNQAVGPVGSVDVQHAGAPSANT